MQQDDLTLQLESASGLDDIKQAIEQLTIRSQGSRTSYSTSTYSSMSGSESEPVRRLIRHSSLETVNTNVTAADEFVWVDSHNRSVRAMCGGMGGYMSPRVPRPQHLTLMVGGMNGY